MLFADAAQLTPEDHRHVGKLADSQRFIAGQEQLAASNYERAIELVDERLKINPDDPEEPWPSKYFIVGGDWGGNYFCINTKLKYCPVFLWHHDSGEFEKIAKSFAAYIEYIFNYYAIQAINE